MRIVVFGAGSIGCFIGGAWAAAGFDVAFIGREGTRNELSVNGLRLTDHTGWQARISADQIDFSARNEQLANAELIVVSVKSTATAQAAEAIAGHARAEAVVLSLQNGISNVRELKKRLPQTRVLAGVIGFNVARIGPGHWHKGTSGGFWVERAPLLENLLKRLPDNSPARFSLRDNMEQIAWGKLLLNLNNAINALSGKTLIEELSDRTYRRALAASMREALEIMRKTGAEPARIGPLPPHLLPGFIALPDVVFNTIGLRLQKIDRNARSSMADDFLAGKPTEIDCLNGEIVRLAEKNDLKAPINARIVEMVKEAERGGRKSWPGPELLKALNGA